MLARLARVLIVVALLAGWQAALLHPLKHVDEHGALIHLGGEPSGASELCDALAALTACAPEAHQRFEPPSAGRATGLSSITEGRRAGVPPFFAQGPPAGL